jgi:hypothetical protein
MAPVSKGAVVPVSKRAAAPTEQRSDRMGVKGEKGSNGYVEQARDYSRGRQKRQMLDFMSRDYSLHAGLLENMYFKTNFNH